MGRGEACRLQVEAFHTNLWIGGTRRNSMRREMKLLGQICSLFGLLSGCSVGRYHTPDAALEKNFYQHEAEFQALLASVSSDETLQMIAVDGLRYRDHTVS